MLQLHLDGNKVDGPASAALAHMLCSLPRIEQLSLVGTDASLASLGALPPASLRQLREVDLRKLTLAPELMALLHAAGPAFAKLKLSAGEMAGRSDFLATLFARTAEHPALYIEFSGTVQAGGLGGGFVADLAAALSQSPACPAGLGLCGMFADPEPLLALINATTANPSSLLTRMTSSLTRTSQTGRQGSLKCLVLDDIFGHLDQAAVGGDVARLGASVGAVAASRGL